MGDQSWKNRKKCDFCGILYHLNGAKSKYKGLQIENTIGSCYLESSKYYKPHWVEIRHVVSEIFATNHIRHVVSENLTEHRYFPFS